MTNEELLELKKNVSEAVVPVGSRITCNPAPTNTDEDFLVLVGKDNYSHEEWLFNHGWCYGGSMVFSNTDPLHRDDIFSSFKKGEYNLIITNDATFHSNFLKASALAKQLNLIKKEDRIILFQAILYNNYASL